MFLWGVDMLEIIGFIFVCIINLFFSGVCLGWFLVGGFELGNILTSKEIGEIAACLSCCAANIYLWTVIAAMSPFSIVAN